MRSLDLLRSYAKGAHTRPGEKGEERHFVRGAYLGKSKTLVCGKVAQLCNATALHSAQALGIELSMIGGVSLWPPGFTSRRRINNRVWEG